MPFNVSRHLRAAARLHPEKPAVVLASGAACSFGELEIECERFAAYFQKRGVRRGMRVVVAVRPGLSFVPTLFGCFRIGAVPVCIDPGMKLRNIMACVRDAGPAAVIGGLPALFLSRLFPSVRLRIPLPAASATNTQYEPCAVSENDEAAILFTSGSTGTPKGVVYTHGAFDAQQRLLRETYAIGHEEIDLVVFPLFALFSAAWGITAIIPRMNPARPAKASGAHLAYLIRSHGVTHTAGSPAIWKNLSAYCASNRVRLPTLKRILMAGAQVPEKLVRGCALLAENIHTPYGATEALPLTTISHPELFERYAQTRQGAGTCVGKPLPGVDVAIIPFIDEPVAEWSDSLRRPAGERGEIAVRARWVTREYFGRGEATRKAKIGEWHRMGDVGYLDPEGRLWFCGRKDHRIFTSTETIFPDPIEAIFDNHPKVPRAALVGVGPSGAQRPVLVVESAGATEGWKQELNTWAGSLGLQGVVFRKKFPVDVRHNIKIDRPKLARLVESEVM